jgi:hypothetical protein
MLISALANGRVYYDPGIKMENAESVKPEFKKRSQFRVRHNKLTALYERSLTHDLFNI